ncbi:MAG: hypothetical protein ACRET4_01330, partial [Steroidobacteraceae bacterium]
RGGLDLKIRGEFLRVHDISQQVFYNNGAFVCTKFPPDIGTRFPAAAAYDPSQWNTTGLEPYVQKYLQNYSRNNFMRSSPM